MMIDYPQRTQLPQLRQLWKTAFHEEDAFLDRFFSLAYDPRRCLCALAGDQVVGMLYWFPCSRGEDQFAYLYAVATHPEHRGKGICRDLMAAAHTLLAGEGYAGTLLYPQDEGLREMYQKLGYETATTVSEGVCTTGSFPAPMHSITVQEYARVRREFLPKNGVIQEGAFLELMKESTRFYQGLDFLLAAEVREDHLYGAELLGNPESAPGILCTLGIPWGRFRTPGSKLPFAMFRPLIPGTRRPEYFGFPLD